MKRSLILIIAFVVFISTCTSIHNGCTDQPNDLLREECLLNQSILTKDSQLCSQITTKAVRENCIADVAIAQNDSTLCASAGAAEFYCKGNVFASQQKSEECEHISDKFWSDFCNMKIAHTSLHPETCKQIDAPITRDECYDSLGRNLSRSDLCPNIYDLGKRNGCLTTVAMNTRNISVCDGIENTVWREGNCYYRLAKETKTEAWCDRIKTNEIKQICKKSFLH